MSVENLKIVAIGGGDNPWDAKGLLEAGLDISGKQKPKVLLIPSARPTQKMYAQSLKEYGGFYLKQGLGVSVLHGFGTMPGEAEIREKFDAADLVYMSGGDSDYMMGQLIAGGVLPHLQRRAREGMVIQGISAGALAPFKRGHSDSLSFRSKDWDFISVLGVGLLPAAATPHANTVTPSGDWRIDSFEQYLRQYVEPLGYAIDDNAALVVADGRVSSLISTMGATVTRLDVADGGVTRTNITSQELLFAEAFPAAA